MELAKSVGAETKLSALERPRFGEALILEMVQVSLDRLGKFEVVVTVDEIDPNCIDVHLFQSTASCWPQAGNWFDVDGSLDEVKTKGNSNRKGRKLTLGCMGRRRW